MKDVKRLQAGPSADINAAEDVRARSLALIDEEAGHLDESL
jgi:hypothetical protein